MQNRLTDNLPLLLMEKTTVVNITPAHHGRLSPWPLASGDVSFFHYHNALEIGYCYEGRGMHYSSAGRYEFSAGDALVVLPERRHLATASLNTATKWIFAYVDLSELYRACGMEAFLGHTLFHRDITLYDIIHCHQYPELTGTIRRFMEAYRTFSPSRLEMLSILCAEILLALSQLDGGLPACRLFSTPRRGKLDTALEWLHLEIEAGHIPQIEDLAAASYMSESNFRAVFRKLMGVAPHQYIMEQVMRRAQQLLQDETQSILAIGADLGFGSVSSFIRNFKQYCGTTPDAYRRSHPDDG